MSSDHYGWRRLAAAALLAAWGAASAIASAGQAHAAVPLPATKPSGVDEAQPVRSRAGPIVVVPRRKPERAVRTRSAAAPASAAPTGPNACAVRLRQLGGAFTELPAIREGRCGADRPVKVSEIAGVALKPAATLTCPTALAAAAWLRNHVQPAARQHLGDRATSLAVAASYVCRTRRTGRGPSTRLSEHGKARALDVRGMTFASGRTMSVAAAGPGRDDDVERFQRAVRLGACESFSTVIGPLTDPAHHDHLHFDLAQRKRGGVVCR